MGYSIKRSTRNRDLFVVATTESTESVKEFPFSYGATALRMVKACPKEDICWVSSIAPEKKAPAEK